MMDVIGVGALNLDKLYIVEKIARGGEEIPIISLKESPGGSAANTIAALARLGMRVGFIGKIGSDREGELILKDLEKEGVDIKGIARSKGRTGIILGFVDSSGERALYAYPGVNDELQINESNLSYARQAKFLHLSSFVGERSYQAQKKLLDKLSGVKISFSPGMLYARKRLENLKQMIEKSFVIFLNEEEIELITGKDYRRGAPMLLELGAKLVVVTLAHRGCFVAGSSESHEIEAYPVKVVDTTGAGDAFAAGFLYGLLLEKDLKTCGKLGNKVASLCIGKVGARESLPYRKDLENFISSLE
ncbi:MAG: carbohydrate kinase family protein [Euryarchaeota archaeon]|nr:carbohydrate kinase family protein [Euryarchaeota archaeon]